MYSNAPLPSVGDLAAAVVARRCDDIALAAPWRLDEEAVTWFSRGAFALAALVGGRARVAGERAPSLWVPSWFCNQSLDIVRRLNGARLVFYPVTDRPAPDWEACRRLAQRVGPPGLFVLVHAFGRPAGAAEARRQCDDWGAWLVEDGAHCLGPASGIGEAGDAVFYCPHKLLAVPDGAVLLLRRPGEAKASLEGLGEGAPAAGNWLARRMLQRLVPQAVLGRLAGRRRPDFETDPPAGPLAATPALSTPARRMIAAQAGRMVVAAAARRDNAAAWMAGLGGLAGVVPMFSGAGNEPVPYRMVWRCADGATARRLFDALAVAAAFPESWPDLPPETRTAPHEGGAALQLRATLVTAPVHQGLRASAIMRRAEAAARLF